MIPFLYSDLKLVVKNTLDLIVIPEVFNNCKSAGEFKQIDLSDETNVLGVETINLGLAIKHDIKNL